MNKDTRKCISDNIARQIREDIKRRNQTAVKQMLVDVVLAVTGWQSLEPFVMDAIERILDGRPVNTQQLQADLLAWQQQQENQPPEGE